MFETKQVLVSATWPRSVHVRNTGFLDWALRIEKSDKNNLTAAIYDSSPGQRAHLKLHADGGTKLPMGGHLAIPSFAVQRTGTGRVVASDKPATMKNKVVIGNTIYQRQGRGKNSKLVRMYFLKSSAAQPADVPFREDFADAIKESALRHFPMWMKRAMG